MNEASDAELWKRAASGSEAAFGVLFQRHASTVYDSCFRRRGNWSEAEDLAAAVFLEAWRRRHEVRPNGESIRPWLLGVATNLLRNDVRSRRRRRTALDRLARLEDGPANRFEDEVAARLDDQRRMTQIRHQLAKLPTGQQDVVALVMWSALSHQEAAIALDVPLGTIKSRLSRARRALRDLPTPADTS